MNLEKSLLQKRKIAYVENYNFNFSYFKFFNKFYGFRKFKIFKFEKWQSKRQIWPGIWFPIKFIYFKKFLPVKVIDTKENFRRIVDHKKNSGWIHRTQLRNVNSLIILEDKIIFKKNSKFSEPVIKIEKGRLVIIKKCLNDWCKIETDEYVGWLKNDNVWGFKN